MVNASKKIKRVCVYGVGGVGGFLGGRMAYAVNEAPNSEYEIYFVGRGDHLKMIRENGLTLVSPGKDPIICKPASAVGHFAELVPMDLILVSVKSYDLENAIRQIGEHCNDDTIIIPILNGVDIYHRVRSSLSKGIVLPGCVYIGGYIEKPGKVIHTGGDLLIFGKDPGYTEVIPTAVFDFLNYTGIRYQWHVDPYPAIWKKFIFIAAFGLVTAESGKTIGAVMADSRLKTNVRNIMNEISEIAKREGVKLSDTIVSESLEKGNQVPYESTTSLQRDIARKKKTNESDLFGGTIIRLGKKYNIPTPVTELIFLYIQNTIFPPQPEYF